MITFSDTDLATMYQAYHNALKRVIFLDYDGTLVDFHGVPELATIDRDSLEMISRLTSDQRNQIIIISGRNRKFLDSQFQYLDITLVAEHGLFVRNAGEDEWQTSMDFDPHFKDAVLPVLIKYANLCPGTFIEEKTGSLAWHYRKADPTILSRVKPDLLHAIHALLEKHPHLDFLEGNEVLEIKSGYYDKGKTAGSLLQDTSYDFMLAAGDDKTDEFLFQALPASAFTIHVGTGTSVARYGVATISQLANILKNLMDFNA